MLELSLGQRGWGALWLTFTLHLDGAEWSRVQVPWTACHLSEPWALSPHQFWGPWGTTTVQKKSNYNREKPAPELCQIAGELLELSPAHRGWLVSWFMFHLHHDSTDRIRVETPSLACCHSKPQVPRPPAQQAHQSGRRIAHTQTVLDRAHYSSKQLSKVHRCKASWNTPGLYHFSSRQPARALPV